MKLQELLVDLTTHYNALMRIAASQLNLTAPQVFILISIPFGGAPMSKLAHKLGLDPSTLTRNIQKLEKIGTCFRRAGSYDKRVKKVFLTSHGLTVVSDLEKILFEMNTAIMEQLDLDAQENVQELLSNLVWAIDCIRDK